MSGAPILSIRGLYIEIANRRQALPILRGVDLAIGPGSVHGLVGESGAGKTTVGKAVVGVLPERARIRRGSIAVDGLDLVGIDERQRRRLLGRTITTILQNPMTALNPVVRIGREMARVLHHHLGLNGEAARAKAIELLAAVHIREPERVLDLYPFELSGGMCQRVIIALAFACDPRLIVADEPTSALDVTVQFTVLRLLHEMQARTAAAVLFITHDLGIVAKICDEISVMFDGRVLELGPTAEVLAAPKHEYTAALLKATPRYDRPDAALHPIPPALRERLRQETARDDGTGPRHL